MAPSSWQKVQLFFHDDKLGGEISVPLLRYVANLRSIVEQLRATCPGAVLIWGETTFVPEDEPGRYPIFG